MPLFFSADDRQQLNKDCDALVKFEVTREDLLAMAEKKVDSTTDIEDSPIKAPPKRKVLSQKKRTPDNKAARIASAKKRAKDILGTPSYVVSSESESEPDDLDLTEQKLRTQEATITELRRKLAVQQKTGKCDVYMIQKSVVRADIIIVLYSFCEFD